MSIKKPYLGKVDEELFAGIIKEQSQDLNCFTISKATKLAAYLKERRFKMATKLLLSMPQSLTSLVSRLKLLKMPDRSWIKHTAYRQNIYISRHRNLNLFGDCFVTLMLSMTSLTHIRTSSMLRLNLFSIWTKYRLEQIASLKYCGKQMPSNYN